MVITEEWAPVPGFERYEISSLGRVMDTTTNLLRATSENNYGHVRISLFSNNGTSRHTRSVAQMVAEAFVEPPDSLCDHVVILDGNLDNVRADNLVWRPRWFMWRYTHQLKVQQPVHYHNLLVLNVVENVEYESIVQAGMVEGLLFNEIWRSTYTGDRLYPTRSSFEIVERV